MHFLFPECDADVLRPGLKNKYLLKTDSCSHAKSGCQYISQYSRKGREGGCCGVWKLLALQGSASDRELCLPVGNFLVKTWELLKAFSSLRWAPSSTPPQSPSGSLLPWLFDVHTATGSPTDFALPCCLYLNGALCLTPFSLHPQVRSWVNLWNPISISKAG